MTKKSWYESGKERFDIGGYLEPKKSPYNWHDSKERKSVDSYWYDAPATKGQIFINIGVLQKICDDYNFLVDMGRQAVALCEDDFADKVRQKAGEYLKFILLNGGVIQKDGLVNSGNTVFKYEKVIIERVGFKLEKPKKKKKERKYWEPYRD